MRPICAGMAVFLLSGAGGLAQTTASCGQQVEAPMKDRGALVVESRSAAIVIIGTDGNQLRVTCTADRDPHNIQLTLRDEPRKDRITITGGAASEENLKVRIEVPHRTSVQLHMSAGEVTVNNLEGNKDIDLYAGQINIAAGDVADYRSVHASVDIGEVKASAWNVDKGGFFRSFTRKTPDGEYRLYAHVLTGEIDLR